MEPSIVKVPADMSYVNAFQALWMNSKPARFLEANPELLDRQESIVSTSEKVVKFFKELNGNYLLDYAGGRLIKIDFRNFPVLTADGYDKEYGFGAAQIAISFYDLIPSSKRFDPDDSCRFSELPKKLVSKL